MGLPGPRIALPGARRRTYDSEQHGHHLLSMNCLHGHKNLHLPDIKGEPRYDQDCLSLVYHPGCVTCSLPWSRLGLYRS